MKTSEVGKESRFGRAVRFTKVNGEMEKGLAKVRKLCQQEQYIKATGKMANDEVSVDKFGRAASSMKEIGFLTIELVTENRRYRMVRCMKASG